MGLLDGLNLGGLLRGALGEAEAAALPAAINAVLAKTQYRDLNGLVAALQKGGLNAQVQRAPIFRLLKISSRPFSAIRKRRNSRAISASPSTRRSNSWLNICPTSSTKRARTARSRRNSRLSAWSHFFTGASMIAKSGYRFFGKDHAQTNLRR